VTGAVKEREGSQKTESVTVGLVCNWGDGRDGVGSLEREGVETLVVVPFPDSAGCSSSRSRSTAKRSTFAALGGLRGFKLDVRISLSPSRPFSSPDVETSS